MLGRENGCSSQQSAETVALYDEVSVSKVIEKQSGFFYLRVIISNFTRMISIAVSCYPHRITPLGVG